MYQVLLHVKAIRSHLACGSLLLSAICFYYSVESMLDSIEPTLVFVEGVLFCYDLSQFYVLNSICSLFVDPYLNDKLERRVLDFLVCLMTWM